MDNMTPLSPELSKVPNKDDVTRILKDQVKIAVGSDKTLEDVYLEAFEEYAELKYGTKFEQAKKALEEIRDYAESCKDMLNEASAGIISQMATKALSTWKEEGNNGTSKTE